MGIIKNSITFGSGFNITAQGPIDSRMVVETIDDLTTVWDKDTPAYKGMIVSVLDDEVYRLVDSDYSDIRNWKKNNSYRTYNLRNIYRNQGNAIGFSLHWFYCILLKFLLFRKRFGIWN